MSKCFDGMKTKMSQLEQEKKEHNESLNKANKQMQDLEHQYRSANIELRNVPCKEKEKAEDLTSVITGVGKALNTNISASSLRDIYRLPGKPGVISPIVAKFVQVSKWNKFLSRVRQYNKDRSVSEKLNTHTKDCPARKCPSMPTNNLHLL